MAAPVNIAAYKEIILVLGTAGVVVPVMSRLKISPVVGFLLAGIIMGPYGLSRLSGQFPLIEYVTISDSSEFPAFAELGILLLMFLIGIELSFNRLITMRRLIFGFGSLQVLGSMAIIAFAAYYSGLSPQAAVLVGAAFSLSSTAIIIEELSLKKRLNSPVGRTAFAVLLKQDLAVIPFIILAGLMARQNTTSLADELWSALFSGVFAIVLLLFAGRYLFKPVLRVVVGTNSPDMFLAAVLSIVIGAGMTASYFGLSMALGGFAAGLLLAETEYRRMIESMIEPFKGILLGVFFISVGFEIDPAVIYANIGTLTLGLILVIACKTAVIVPTGYLFGYSTAKGVELGLLLGPAGEFAFVLLGGAASSGLIGKEHTSLLMSCVALGMAILPALVVLGEKIGFAFKKDESPLDVTGGSEAVGQGGAIVIGSGRVGSLVSLFLDQQSVQHILVDSNAAIVKGKRLGGIKIYYGDATHPEFLKKCGLEQAKTLIITINNPKKAEEITAIAHQLKPGVNIIARAHDEVHAKRLYRLGADVVIPETVEASLQLAEASLRSLGFENSVVMQAIDAKRELLDQALKSG